MRWTNKNCQVWYLHKKEVMFGRSGLRVNYFFAKTKKEGFCDLPDGYKVVETKTGMPVLKKMWN